MCGPCDPKVWLAVAVLGLLLVLGLMPSVGTPPSPPADPVAEFVASVDSGVAPLTVTFDASSSYDPDGDILEYLWDFGDGTVDFGPQVTHAFAVEGNYAVALRVVDDCERTASASAVIAVAAPEPEVEEPEPSEEATTDESGT